MHFDGEYAEDFDVFYATKASQFKHGKFVDIYDNFDSEYHCPVIKPPTHKFDYGTDWKQALLDRAAKLGLYNELILHDNNVVPFPFPDDHFKTIYSNSVYWIPEVKPLLRDIHRMIRPGGKVLLEVLTPHLWKTFDKLSAFLSAEAIDLLDRKRRETTPGGHLYPEWVELFESAGFKLVEARNVFHHSMLVDMWNVGLRPVSHLLIQMVDNMSPEQRLAIKREWVDIFMELFKPLLGIEPDYTLENAPYLMFHLTK